VNADVTDEELAGWAENDMTLNPASSTALHGAAAAARGRAALEAALGGPDAVERAIHGGRPSIDPAAAPGQHSRTRQVRLAADVSSQLDELAAAQHRRPSDLLRDAVAAYLNTHKAAG
jgi:hypothetical protein